MIEVMHRTGKQPRCASIFRKAVKPKTCLIFMALLCLISLSTLLFQSLYLSRKKIFITDNGVSLSDETFETKAAIVKNYKTTEQRTKNPNKLISNTTAIFERHFKSKEQTDFNTVVQKTHNGKQKNKEAVKPFVKIDPKNYVRNETEKYKMPNTSISMSSENLNNSSSHNLEEVTASKLEEHFNMYFTPLPTFSADPHNQTNSSLKISHFNKGKHKGVVILTNYRSGSTFMGELFNQHPDAFYTFEPLLPYSDVCSAQATFARDVLHHILKCDFPDLRQMYDNKKDLIRNDHLVYKECLRDNFCFRRKSKNLCDKRMCSNGNQHTCEKCDPIDLHLLKNLCQSKKMSVVKVIRICNIEKLKSIVEDSALDLKIIHLVRDPRGIQSSRSKIQKDWNIKLNSKLTCNRLLHNGLSGNANTSDTKWLQGRYLRIRYEDLSLDPLNITEKIYKFTDLDFTPNMKSWIKSNTHRSSSKIVNPYTTRRDSVSTMEAWRKHLKLSQVLDIQSACTDVMKQFGYVNVTSQSRLENFEVKLIR